MSLFFAWETFPLMTFVAAVTLRSMIERSDLASLCSEVTGHDQITSIMGYRRRTR